MRETGTYQRLGWLQHFVPHALPPSNPPLELTSEIMALHGEANFYLGQLNEMSQCLPNPKRFIKAYVIKEALLSSAIEGIHTTLVEVFTASLTATKPNKETQLVVNYTQALDIALHMLQEKEFPLVARVILAAHEALLSGGDGDMYDPGAYRKQSVRVGLLVPPPAPEVPRLMGELEKYINEPSDLPPLIRIGLAHVQFETIHPFLDGNGRIGRLLIVLMMIQEKLLQVPILYPSYYFKKHHMEYYERLDRVRTHGDFEGWIAYYLRAIRDSALDAYQRAKEIEVLKKKLATLIQTNPAFTKKKETALNVLEFLFSQPIVSISEVSKGIGKTYNTVHNILSHFVDEGLISERSSTKRNKLFCFDPYLALLER